MENTFKDTFKPLIKLAFFSLFLFGMSGTALAFANIDDEGDVCPIPRACKKTDNRVNDQDNGYHNTLQALRGAKEKTVNVIELTPETDTAPATYTTTSPPKYKGMPK